MERDIRIDLERVSDELTQALQREIENGTSEEAALRAWTDSFCASGKHGTIQP